ncbi:MAG TPA: Na+/H+ antiporter NhaA [Ramlibacter sp.]|nr:Na+/H+ antiporter NhaA [Ramlibacter sp.]
MSIVQRRLSLTFQRFFDSEKSAGLILLVCTAASLLLANSPWGQSYLAFWQLKLAGLSIEHWVNDALMAVFFLLIGLELERELYSGELSDFRNALLPICVAIGGIAVPALVHFSLNAGTDTQPGIGIPMATDIAFALGVLALVGSRIPASLKVFLTALAVMDDLGAIIVIACFYTAKLSLLYLGAALAVFAALLFTNRVARVTRLLPYLAGGVLMWFFMLKSGIHATIAGVLLAFAIPYSARQDDAESPSHRLEHALHKPVAFLILPVFALANTGVVISADWYRGLTADNSLGILLGLLVGKPVGVVALSFGAVAMGICKLPADLGWKHVVGAGLLAGIGFTMSIFITNLAFAGNAAQINASKIAILVASLAAGALGFAWLKLFGRPLASDADLDTMDFHAEAGRQA